LVSVFRPLIHFGSYVCFYFCKKVQCDPGFSRIKYGTSSIGKTRIRVPFLSGFEIMLQGLIIKHIVEDGTTLGPCWE